MAPLATTSIRRSRFIILLTLAVIVILFLFHGDSWGLPESLKDAGVPISKGNFMHFINNRKPKPTVDEIYGLIHLVTNLDEEHQHVLSQNSNLDPTQPVDMALYAPGEENDVNWAQEMDMLNERYPVVVFSKSFCPYSRKAKMLLESYALRPLPKIIEVDLRDDSTQIKAILTRLTKQSTFPNVFVKGKSIGGSDDLQRLHKEGSLRSMLEKAGIQVTGTEN